MCPPTIPLALHCVAKHRWPIGKPLFFPPSEDIWSLIAKHGYSKPIFFYKHCLLFFFKKMQQMSLWSIRVLSYSVYTLNWTKISCTTNNRFTIKLYSPFRHKIFCNYNIYTYYYNSRPHLLFYNKLTCTHFKTLQYISCIYLQYI
jgi:hypothetical protein